MSHETDRVPVPTNGRGPHPPVAVPGVSEPVGPVGAASAGPVDAPDRSPTVTETTPAFTPAQLAIGFGIVASLILLVAGRRRRGRRS